MTPSRPLISPSGSFRTLCTRRSARRSVSETSDSLSHSHTCFLQIIYTAARCQHLSACDTSKLNSTPRKKLEAAGSALDRFQKDSFFNPARQFDGEDFKPYLSILPTSNRKRFLVRIPLWIGFFCCWNGRREQNVPRQPQKSLEKIKKGKYRMC